jgi:hypothetical protein
MLICNPFQLLVSSQKLLYSRLGITDGLFS